jgi:hypothetical protein
MPDAPFTTDELRLYARRHELTSLPDEHFERLAELAEKVRTTGLAIARMPSEEDEPAHAFSVPLR